MQKITPDSFAAMVCEHPVKASAALPQDMFFRLYTPQDANIWCALQTSVGNYASAEEAQNMFAFKYECHRELLSRRLVFLCDSAGEALGCACLWPDTYSGHTSEKLCGLAVLPHPQHDTLTCALIAQIIDIYFENDCSGGIFALVNPQRRPLVAALQAFGFRQHYSMASAPNGTVPLDAAPISEDGLTMFQHASMFVKCSNCKVFEIEAPAQSGDTLHSHDYTQIWYVTRGSCQHFVEGKEYQMLVGDIFLLPPKVMHRTLLHSGAAIVCCEFYMEGMFPGVSDVYFNRMRELTQGISFSILFQQELHSTQPKFTLGSEAQRRVEALMHGMVEEYSGSDSFYEDYLHLQILELLLILAREYTRQPAQDASKNVYDKYRSMVEDGIRYIDEHYAEPLTLESICKISMVSKTYFCYIFKLLTRQTFVEYLMNLRIRKAMELLRQTNRSVIDISQAVGFNDSTHFSRTFKHLKGISPREYRTANRNQ